MNSLMRIYMLKLSSSFNLRSPSSLDQFSKRKIKLASFGTAKLSDQFDMSRDCSQIVCHAANGLHLKWSGRTNLGTLSGPAGQCKITTVGPS